MTRRITQCAVEDGEQSRLDVFLSRRFTYHSRSFWQSEIRAERINVNGKNVTDVDRKLSFADRVEYFAPEAEEPTVDAAYEILYDDEHFIAVNKSGDIPVHPSGAYFSNTLLSVLEKDYGSKLYMIHRLDRETSGIILFAKSSEAARRFQNSLENAQKTYTAIVHGCTPESFKCDLPIGDAYAETDCRTDIVRKKRRAFKGAPESAETLFSRIICFNGFSLIKAMPQTGRLHQIRVHLRAMNFPIVGDKIYGLNERLFLKFIEGGMTADLLDKLLMRRCALHSSSLNILHPFTGKHLTIRSALPSDFVSFIMTKKNG